MPPQNSAAEEGTPLLPSAASAEATGFGGETDGRQAPLRSQEASVTSPTSAAPPTAADNLRRARRLLYVSHGFSQAAEISWQFALVLFLSAFTDYESLVLVSTYGLTSGSTVCLAGGAAGRFVDESPSRLHTARVFIWTENMAVLVATGCCYLLLSRDTFSADDGSKVGDDDHTGWIEETLRGVPLDPVSIILLVCVHVFGSVANVLDKGFMVAIERDWIVVMSRMASSQVVINGSAGTADEGESGGDEGEQRRSGQSRRAENGRPAPSDGEEAAAAAAKQWLSETNVAMRQIDLSCKVVAPSLAGFVVVAFSDTNDLRIAAALVGMLNIFSLAAEYWCTAAIYDLVPALAHKSDRGLEVDDAGTDDVIETFVESEGRRVASPLQGKQQPQRRKTEEARSSCWLFNLSPNLRIYFEQSVAAGGVALALLYLNVLTFGALMTAYLVWRDMRLDAIGFWRGVSSAIGLLGTVVYHLSSSRMSLESTGEWSITFQFLCLTMCYASLWVPNNGLSLAILIGGVCASRVGLWVFDISITQLMQQRVPEDVRGVVGGVQHSLNAFCGLLTFGFGIIFPDPGDFHYLVALGYAGVGLGMILFTVGVFFRKGHAP